MGKDSNNGQKVNSMMECGKMVSKTALVNKYMKIRNLTKVNSKMDCLKVMVLTREQIIFHM